MNGNQNSLKGLNVVDRKITPHSLGKLIEWKLCESNSLIDCVDCLTPHSLGKLIEWKLAQINLFMSLIPDNPPHSLGKLIEWKLPCKIVSPNYFHSPLVGETN